MTSLDNISDQPDGDLSLASQTPGRRRNKSKPGKTASLSIRRKVMFVFEAVRAGRPDSATALACLAGLDGPAVRFGVWRRARRHPAVMARLGEGWKREAEAFSVKRSQQKANT